MSTPLIGVLLMAAQAMALNNERYSLVTFAVRIRVLIQLSMPISTAMPTLRLTAAPWHTDITIEVSCLRFQAALCSTIRQSSCLSLTTGSTISLATLLSFPQCLDVAVEPFTLHEQFTLCLACSHPFAQQQRQRQMALKARQ